MESKGDGEPVGSQNPGARHKLPQDHDQWSYSRFSDYLSSLVLAEEYSVARSLAERRHLMHPDEPDFAFLFARFLLHEDPGAACAWYARRVKGNSRIAKWHLRLADLYFEAQEWNEGLATLASVAAQFTQRGDLLTSFVINSTFVPDLDASDNLATLKRLITLQYGAAAAPSGSVSARPRYTIGFVCSALRRHSISAFFMPLLAHLDRRKFMVAVYSSSSIVDEVTAELQRMSDLWYDVHDLKNEDLLALIRSDRPDVLIDLDNHSAPNRLWVFSQRAAPIQMTFYGLNASTGLTSMDYRLTDAIVDPAGTEAHYTEKLLRTRHCHIAYMGTTLAAVSDPWRTRDAMTFGSFNDMKKVNAAQVALWADVLQRFPTGRLIVGGFDDGLRTLQMQRWLLQAGGDASRISVDRFLPVREFYQRIQSADVAIDTWPFGGGVTTAATLSLGVPVLSAIGPRAHSRVSASMMCALGLDRYVVESPDQLAARAAEIGADPEGLSADRATIAERFSQTIGNGKRLAAEVGELLIRAIERYRKGMPAKHDSL